MWWTPGLVFKADFQNRAYPRGYQEDWEQAGGSRTTVICVLTAKWDIQKRRLFHNSDLSLLGFLAETRSRLTSRNRAFRHWNRLFNILSLKKSNSSITLMLSRRLTCLQRSTNPARTSSISPKTFGIHSLYFDNTLFFQWGTFSSLLIPDHFSQPLHQPSRAHLSHHSVKIS